MLEVPRHGTTLMKKISQAEAYRLRQRVAQLEKEKQDIRDYWKYDFPGGVNIATSHPSESSVIVLKTARKLGFCIISVPTDNGLLHYAVKV